MKNNILIKLVLTIMGILGGVLTTLAVYEGVRLIFTSPTIIGASFGVLLIITVPEYVKYRIIRVLNKANTIA